MYTQAAYPGTMQVVTASEPGRTLIAPHFTTRGVSPSCRWAFCYPGRDANGGDRPPRPECAPQWHERILGELPSIELTLLVGRYAQGALSPAGRPNLHDGNRGGMARSSPGIHGPAAPVLAQHGMAPAQSLVREGGCSRASPTHCRSGRRAGTSQHEIADGVEAEAEYDAAGGHPHPAESLAGEALPHQCGDAAERKPPCSSSCEHARDHDP